MVWINLSKLLVNFKAVVTVSTLVALPGLAIASPVLTGDRSVSIRETGQNITIDGSICNVNIIGTPHGTPDLRVVHERPTGWTFVMERGKPDPNPNRRTDPGYVVKIETPLLASFSTLQRPLCTITAYVPKNRLTRVSVRTSSGTIATAGLQARHLVIHSQTGNITARTSEASTSLFTSVRGEVRIDDFSGELGVTTGSGDIHVSSHRGGREIGASSSSGRVLVTSSDCTRFTGESASNVTCAPNSGDAFDQLAERR